MKYVISFVLLCYLLLPIIALAENPACLPGDADADSATPHVYGSLSPLGGALYVWCDVGHKWEISKKSIVGAASEFDPAAVKAAVEAAASLNSWSAAYTEASSKFVPGPDDAALLAAIKALPKPDKIPPSGLVTQSVKAYKLNVNVNAAPSFTLVGTVPLGTTVDASQQVGGYCRVDRTKVTFPAGVIKPPAVYAVCK